MTTNNNEELTDNIIQLYEESIRLLIFTQAIILVWDDILSPKSINEFKVIKKALMQALMNIKGELQTAITFDVDCGNLQ